MVDRHLGDKHDVRKIVKFGDTKRNQLIKAGLFPLPIVMPFGRNKYWDLDEVKVWVKTKLDARQIKEPDAAPTVFSAWYERATAPKASKNLNVDTLKNKHKPSKASGSGSIHLIQC